VTSPFEFVTSPFECALQIFVWYCAPWRSTDLIQFEIHRIKIIIYLSDPPIRAGIFREFSTTVLYFMSLNAVSYGVAFVSRLLQIIGLFCKRAL